MPNLSIKDVPEALAEKLRRRAARNHRSLQGELMAILENAIKPVAGAATILRVAESAAAYAVPKASQSQPDAVAAATRKARLKRLQEIAAAVNPAFRAAARLTREQAHDRAFLRTQGI